MGRKPKNYKISRAIPAIQKAFTIMEFLTSQEHGYTITELSRIFKIPISTTSSVLYSLVSCGYLTRDEKGDFTPTLRLLLEASKVLNQLELREIAKPELKKLREATGLAAVPSIRDGDHMVCIEKIEGKSEIRIASSVGRRLPMHSTCTGKAILAHLPEDEVAEFANSTGLRPATANTITSLSILKKELARVRAQGFAADDQEYTVGIKGIAVPVFDHNGSAVATISTGGAAFELNHKLKNVISAVKNASTKVSERLGYREEAMTKVYQVSLRVLKDSMCDSS